MKRSLLFAASLFGLLLVTTVSTSAADWPQWRGLYRDGHSQDTGLLKSWPEDGPPIAWKVSGLGQAYSTVAVANGRIYTMGNVDGEPRVICLEESTGDKLWSVKPPTEDRPYEHGKGDGARGTPTVDGNRVYTIGGWGDVTCLDAQTGNVIWSTHLLKQLNGGKRPPGWGYSESPLIDGDHVIVTPGGEDGAVVALNKHSGKVVWRSEDVTDKAHYCSATLADVGGVRQIIQFTNRRVVGLDAQTGKLLWDYSGSANRTANVATPIFFDNSVFSSSAYGTGGGLVRLIREGGSFQAEEVYFERRMANHHGGIVLVDGFLYGFGSGGLICMDFTTGDIAWRNRSVRKGSLCYADGHLYCLGEKNEMALVEANPKEYVEKGRFTLPDGEWPTWAHPVVANGHLYFRDMDTLTRYDIRAK